MRVAQWILSALVGFGLFADRTSAADAIDRYPTKPIRIVVGSTPGGTPDVLARMIGARLGESWKQAVVIENRVPNVIGYNAVAKSTPDGYTLLLTRLCLRPTRCMSVH
jgi:tripartite-type tricarboxylate transporter receptor subunit TctC